MAALSDYLENELLDHFLGTGAYAAPTTVYIGLFTTPTDDAGGGTELTGNGYARQAVAFDPAAGGSASNTALITFQNDGTGDWGTITHQAVFDAATAGNMLMHSALSSPQVVNADGRLEFAPGTFTASLD